jgi:hypothetical protein
MTKDIILKCLPYLVCFLLGAFLFRSCGNGKGISEVTVIEKPTPTVHYIERWKTDTVRFVTKQVVRHTDTITLETIVNRLDTVLLIDTVEIVKAWLTELNKYDTTVVFDGADIGLQWQNYQNLSENFKLTYKPKNVPLNWALGVHANVGLLTNFKNEYTPLFGLGLQGTVKKTYVAVDYGFNGQHYIGFRTGYNFISR